MNHLYTKTAFKALTVALAFAMGGAAAQSQVPVAKLAPTHTQPASRPEGIKTGISRLPEAVQIPRASLKADPWGDEATWSEWEFYGNIHLIIPTLNSFLGGEGEEDPNNQKVYIRKQLNSDPSLSNEPWQIRIDGVFGSNSLYLDYDYHSKHFKVRTMVLPVEVPQVLAAEIEENFELMEHPEIRCLKPYGEKYNDRNWFFPEGGDWDFDQLSFVFARGVAGTDKEGYLYLKYYYPGVKDLDNHARDYQVSNELYDCEGLYSNTYPNYIKLPAEAGNTLSFKMKAEGKVKGYRFQVVPEEYRYHVSKNDVVHFRDYPDFGGKWPHKDYMFTTTGDDVLHEIKLEMPRHDSDIYINIFPLTAEGEVAARSNTLWGMISCDYGRWEPLGEGTLSDRTEAIFSTEITDDEWDSSVFDADGRFLKENPSWKVTVEKDADNPGRYRVVNPYVNSPWRSQIGWEFEPLPFDGYLYFDASDPDKVMLETSIDGNTYGCGSKMARHSVLYDLEWSEDHWAYFSESEPEHALGKLTGNKIVMPAFSILRECNSRRWLPQNVPYEVTGSFEYPDLELTLPDGAAIEVPEADDYDAPAEYFNLQGIRIAAPEAGQTVIVRRGAKAAKVRF